MHWASRRINFRSLTPLAAAHALDRFANADIVSDMKTFTVRDLDRTPSVVLDACDRDGEARIRRRNGRTYRLLVATEPARVITALPDFAARRKKLFPKPLTAAFARALDQAIRGE